MSFQAEVQAQEVQSGLWFLHQALSLLQSSVTNTALQSHIENSIRNLLSTNAVLRSLNFQVRLWVLRGDTRKSKALGNHFNHCGLMAVDRFYNALWRTQVLLIYPLALVILG